MQKKKILTKARPTATVGAKKAFKNPTTRTKSTKKIRSSPTKSNPSKRVKHDGKESAKKLNNYFDSIRSLEFNAKNWRIDILSKEGLMMHKNRLLLKFKFCLILIISGTWVQCTDCKKWRLLQNWQDPATLPEHWNCEDLTNDNETQNSCDFPEVVSLIGE